ncbi:MAG: hypothetical protein N3E51_04975 [Candidatus Micrarchaeota archaeon]|nr:hypothetical protein [Candidatus Micrarchaeota archaeon]
MISISLDKPEYMPGETIRASITLKLQKPTKARGIYATLSCHEKHRVTEHRIMDKYDFDREKELGLFRETHISSHTAVHEKTLFEKEVRVAGEGVFSSGDYPLSIELPKNAPPTSHEFGHDNKIHIWKLSVKLDIPLALDLNAEREIFVGGLG